MITVDRPSHLVLRVLCCLLLPALVAAGCAHNSMAEDSGEPASDPRTALPVLMKADDGASNPIRNPTNWGRVDDWRGDGMTMGVAVAGSFRETGASLLAMAPFPSRRSSNRTGGFPRIRLSDEIMPSPTESWPCAVQGE